jgi:cold shock CspA family protein
VVRGSVVFVILRALEEAAMLASSPPYTFTARRGGARISRRQRTKSFAVLLAFERVKGNFEMATRFNGRIVRWDSDRGFGFVRSDDNFDGATKSDIFCHCSALPSDKIVNVGDRISFAVRESYRGLRAEDVQLLK